MFFGDSNLEKVWFYSKMFKQREKIIYTYIIIIWRRLTSHRWLSTHRWHVHRSRRSIHSRIHAASSTHRTHRRHVCGGRSGHAERGHASSLVLPADSLALGHGHRAHAASIIDRIRLTVAVLSRLVLGLRRKRTEVSRAHQIAHVVRSFLFSAVQIVVNSFFFNSVYMNRLLLSILKKVVGNCLFRDVGHWRTLRRSCHRSCKRRYLCLRIDLRGTPPHTSRYSHMYKFLSMIIQH